MKTRILSAAIALPLFLAVLLVPVTWPTALLLAAMCAIGARELLWATGLVPHKRLVAYAMICGALVCLWSYLGCPRWLGLAGVTAFFLALAGELLAAHAKLSFSEIAAAAFAGLLVPLLLSALVRIRCMEHGAALITGALTDTMVLPLLRSGVLRNCRLVVKDPSKVLLTADTLDKLASRQVALETEEAARTLCITVNPVSAYGWKFDKDDFLHRMREAVDVPVINVKEELA